MTIMARADVLLDVWMPGHTTAQVRANIREHLDIALIFAQYVYAIAVDGLFPSIDGCAGKLESGGNTHKDQLSGVRAESSRLL